MRQRSCSCVALPSSSRMHEPLLTRLSAHYHLVAPDYPGFGHSDTPTEKALSYTFDHIAQVINHFTEALGLDRYALYMQDYGGPARHIGDVEILQAMIALRGVYERHRSSRSTTGSGSTLPRSN